MVGFLDRFPSPCAVCGDPAGLDSLGIALCKTCQEQQIIDESRFESNTQDLRAARSSRCSCPAEGHVPECEILDGETVVFLESIETGISLGWDLADLFDQKVRQFR